MAAHPAKCLHVQVGLGVTGLAGRQGSLRIHISVGSSADRPGTKIGHLHDSGEEGSPQTEPHHCHKSHGLLVPAGGGQRRGKKYLLRRTDAAPTGAVKMGR